MEGTLLFLSLAILAKATASSHFAIVAPSAVRFGHEETVSLNIFDASNQRVKVWLEHNGKKFSQKEVTVVSEEEPEIITIKVTENDIFDKETSTKATHVTLKAQCMNIEKEAELLVSYKSGYLIVQTDKPLYRPGQTVNYRVLALDEGLKHAKDAQLAIDIIDPKSRTVRRTKVTAKKRIYADTFDIPTYTELRLWTIRAYYMGQFSTEARVTFQVREYVLPTYEVTVTPSVNCLLPDMDQFKVAVQARYTYNKPVDGSVGLDLYLCNKKHGTKEFVMSMERRYLDLGNKEFTIKMEDILNSKAIKKDKRIRDFPPAGYHLQVAANVFEYVTANEEDGESEIIFATSPYQYKFTKSRQTYRPGSPYSLEVEVLHANGKPLLNGWANVKMTMNNEVMEEAEPVENGRIKSSFDTVQQAGSPEMKFQVEIDGYTSDEHIIKPYLGVDQVEIEMVVDQGKAQIQIHSNAQGEKGYTGFIMMVIARGKVLLIKHYRVGLKKEEILSDDLLEEVSNGGRAIVFYIKKNTKEVISDSVYFEIKPRCRSGGLELKSQKDVYRPGEIGTLLLKGEPNMHVGLNAIDTALLLLNSDNILKTNTMFKLLEQHDLGCGAGGGVSSSDVFKNAGVVFLTNANVNNIPRKTLSCDGNQREKRRAKECYADINCCLEGASFAMDKIMEREMYALEEFEYYDYYDFQDFNDGPDLKTQCYAQAMNLSKKDLPTICLSEYLRHCLQTVESNEETEVSGKSLGDESDYERDIRLLNDNEEVIYRKHFMESWCFEEQTLDSNGHAEKELMIPDSITTWEIQAIGLSEGKGVCIAEPINVKGFKDFFIQLDMPYKAVRLENVVVKASIFNYYKGEITSEGKEHRKTIHTCLSPLNEMKACENDPEVYQVDRIRGEQTMKIRLEMPEDAVPTTGHAVGYAKSNLMTDVVQKVISGTESLLRMPTGCGEQTMIYLAPVVYVMRYLKLTKQVTDDIETMGNEFIRKGVERELTYRHPDFSYAAWQSRASSTWLTAFVMKVFCQAKKAADDSINTDVHIVPTLKYLLKVHKKGEFYDPQPVIHREMIGQLSEKDPSLTAFVLISFLECDGRTADMKDHVSQAMRYLEGVPMKMYQDNPYLLAITTYALGMANSTKKWDFMTLLKAKGHRDGAKLFWGNPGGKPANAAAVETTAYALLAYLTFNFDEECASIVRWLIQQREGEGSFRTTMDTVVGLQALSEYTIRTNVSDVNLKVTILNAGKMGKKDKSFAITKENAQVVKVVDGLHRGDGVTDLTVKVTGTGTAYFDIDLRYNLFNQNESCPFNVSDIDTKDISDKIPIDPMIAEERDCDICGACRKGMNGSDFDYDDEDAFAPVGVQPKAFSRGLSRRRRDSDAAKFTTKKYCVRFSISSSNRSDMAIVNFGLETGVRVIRSDLDELMRTQPVIARYEEDNQGYVTFYLDYIDEEPVDFIFRISDSAEADHNTRQMAKVDVYEYYAPERICTKFYGIGAQVGKPVPYECNAKKNRNCVCLQNVCAKNFEQKYKKLVRRGGKPAYNLKARICATDNADYAVLVDMESPVFIPETQYMLVTGTIKKVLHRGVENLKVGSEMSFRYKAYCEQPDIPKAGGTYYVIGKDGFKKPGQEEYLYELMDPTVIIKQTNQRPLNRVMKAFERLMARGCQL